MAPKDNDNNFQMDRNVSIILYGAATIGSLLYSHLTKQKFRVAGFMDMRAEEIKELCGLPVYSIDDGSVSKDNVILISVKNVFEHERIAAELQKRGFHKLIYRPYASLNGEGSVWERKLNEAYDKIADYKNGKEISDCSVPLSVKPAASRLKLSGVISESEHIVTVYVPVTLLYSDKKEGEPEFSVLFLKPHLGFVRYVLGLEGGKVEDYLQYCMEGASKAGNFQMTEAWKENVIKSRAEVYVQMNHRYHLNRAFFEEQAPFVRWNQDRNYFNLQSGKHRATFLAAKGDNYIAVKMSKEDYNLWVQEPLAKDTGRAAAAVYPTGMAVPIENPYFYEYACCEEQFWYQLIRKIIEHVPEAGYYNSIVETLGGCSFLVAVQEDGFVKRYLKRCGFRVFSFQNASGLELKLNSVMMAGKGVCAGADFDQEFAYALVEEWSEAYERDPLKAKKIFLISEKEHASYSRLMTGIYKGRRAAVYLKKDVDI